MTRFGCCRNLLMSATDKVWRELPRAARCHPFRMSCAVQAGHRSDAPSRRLISRKYDGMGARAIPNHFRACKPSCRRGYCCCREQNSASCRENLRGSYTHDFLLCGHGAGKRCAKVNGSRAVKHVPWGGPKSRLWTSPTCRAGSPARCAYFTRLPDDGENPHGDHPRFLGQQ